MSVRLVTFLLILNFFSLSNCANILAYIPTPSYSHQVVFQPLWKELSLRGHQVTLITTDPINDPSLTNLTEIDLHFTYDWIKSIVPKLITTSSIQSIKIYFDAFIATVEMQMQHPDVQKVIVNSSYDLIIAEYLTFIPFALSKRFRCPTIAVTSLEATEMVYEYFDTKTFIRRIISVVFEIVFRLHLHWYYFPKQDVVIKNLFGRESTPCLELMDQISLLLENTELVFGKIRPRVPTVIPVGGIHRVPAKPLPQELKRILDSARNGFIYFSLGSNVKIKLLPEKVRQIIIETFSELPYTVLWKYEQTTLDDIPKNVFVSKWFPQTDVLRHGNIKLFVTQGGLQSLEEALLSKVPIVGMPFFADQPKNIKKIVEYGFGLFIDYKTLTKEKFKKVLVEVIENPQYRKAIGRWSNLAQDQPMSGLDQAVWWVEYVIRHKGAQHLRKTKIVERWYEKFMLDVIGVILIVLGLVSFLVVLVVRVVFKVFKMCFKVCVEKEKSH